MSYVLYEDHKTIYDSYTSEVSIFLMSPQQSNFYSLLAQCLGIYSHKAGVQFMILQHNTMYQTYETTLSDSLCV